ncbi:unnamed protein product [Penicillium roqueforti FM164]|uniref:Genomic scaffold, ProqFM164S02 n=1 Tax=Penicillium roqueforti (strain FM164) TaxID=1365484 RepID=W6Q1Z9_PENRF|nr:unnamed protein product [Penicillium roqueforti FM164]
MSADTLPGASILYRGRRFHVGHGYSNSTDMVLFLGKTVIVRLRLVDDTPSWFPTPGTTRRSQQRLVTARKHIHEFIYSKGTAKRTGISTEFPYNGKACSQ